MNRLRISNISSRCHRPNNCQSISCLIATALTTSAVVLTLLTTGLYISTIHTMRGQGNVTFVRATSAIGGVGLLVITLLLISLLYRMLATRSKPFADTAIIAAFVIALIFLISAAMCSIITSSGDYIYLVTTVYASYVIVVTYLLLLTLVVSLSLRVLYKQTKQINTDRIVDLEAGVALTVASTTSQQS